MRSREDPDDESLSDEDEDDESSSPSGAPAAVFLAAPPVSLGRPCPETAEAAPFSDLEPPAAETAEAASALWDSPRDAVGATSLV